LDLDWIGDELMRVFRISVSLPQLVAVAVRASASQRPRCDGKERGESKQTQSGKASGLQTKEEKGPPLIFFTLLSTISRRSVGRKKGLHPGDSLRSYNTFCFHYAATQPAIPKRIWFVFFVYAPNLKSLLFVAGCCDSFWSATASSC
jgi:hypothetical protein